MTDDEFIDYVETHSQTDRALFHREHIMRIAALAGREAPELRGEWYAMRAPVAHPMVAEARSRISQSKTPQCCG
jgi:hypothetical protein